MQFGALLYDTLIYTGSDSIVNKPYVLKGYVAILSSIFFRDLEAERRHLDGCAQHRAAVRVEVV